MGPVDVAIVGGGAAGALVAIQLLHKARGPFRVCIIDRAGAIGRGVAYATPEPSHVLNVAASGMSAFPDRADDFVRWSGAAPDDFVPRATYGEYLQATLGEAGARAAPGVSLLALGGEAVSLSADAAGVCIRLADGTELSARAAVLALGNFPSAELPIPASDAYRSSPWEPGALDGVPPDAQVLLLGTGLTMVDAALALDRRGHTGTLHALSRHGLLPQVQGDALASRLRIGATGVRGLLRALRLATRRDGEWRPAVDGLRPVTQRIWMRLSDSEKRRFLRHVRAFWDVHRHRMAPVVAEQIARLRAVGRLLVHAGTLRSIAMDGPIAIARYRPRGERVERELRIARIVNCTGPAMYLADVRHPLIASLLESGLVRADSLGMGLSADHDGALNGNAPGRLFTLGNLRRGELWETTAIPELRAQAEAIASRLLRELTTSAASEATM
jgi:uncharacterized NAD(P)/FAD-binding protein YdhS